MWNWLDDVADAWNGASEWAGNAWDSVSSAAGSAWSTAGDLYNSADSALGGWLPGGDAAPSWLNNGMGDAWNSTAAYGNNPGGQLPGLDVAVPSRPLDLSPQGMADSWGANLDTAMKDSSTAAFSSDPSVWGTVKDTADKATNWMEAHPNLTGAAMSVAQPLIASALAPKQEKAPDFKLPQAASQQQQAGPKPQYVQGISNGSMQMDNPAPTAIPARKQGSQSASAY